MALICQRCGCEIDGKSPICMNCGAAIPNEQISKETKERLKAYEHDKHVASNASSIRALGAVLIILSILAGFISMFMIFHSDFELFRIAVIGETICFSIGLLLYGIG